MFEKLTLAALLALLGLAAPVALAQGLATRPIRIISPYLPGGSTDLVARLVAPKLSSALGPAVVVENRPGAAGTIGAAAVAQAAPDGNTLLMHSAAILTPAVVTSRTAPYDPVRDFTAITAAVSQPGVMLIHSGVPAASFKELLAYAKSNPGKLFYGTTGVASSFHFMGEIVKLASGLSMSHVPYKGGVQVAQAVASGEVALALVSITSGMTAVRSDKARALAVFSDRRFVDLPDVPLISDLLPGVERPADWLAFFGPAGMNPALLARIHAEIVKALLAPDVVKALHAGGMEPLANTPDEFAAMIKRDIALLRKMVPIAGIKLE